MLSKIQRDVAARLLISGNLGQQCCNLLLLPQRVMLLTLPRTIEACTIPGDWDRRSKPWYFRDVPRFSVGRVGELLFV